MALRINLFLLVLSFLAPHPCLSWSVRVRARGQGPLLPEAGPGDRQVSTSLAQGTCTSIWVMEVCTFRISLGLLPSQDHLAALTSASAGEGITRVWPSRAQGSPDKASILSRDGGFSVLLPCGHFVLYVSNECASICCATGSGGSPQGECPAPTTQVLHVGGAPSPDPEKALCC